VLESKVDATVAADVARKAAQLLNAGNSRILLDLSVVDLVDGTGLDPIIDTGRNMVDRGAVLAVCGSSAPVLDAFRQAELEDIIEIYSDRDEALANLVPGSSPESEADRRISLSIESQFDNVSFVGNAINKLCGAIFSSEMIANEVELCAVEAVNNCIEHAYEMQAGNRVDIVLSSHPDRIVMEVCDTGMSMDPKCLDVEMPPPPTRADALAEQGRGLLIIRKVMDSVSYHTAGNRNCLTMVKRVQRPD
jgi:serine/threonine-protein kinase RsbW